MIDEKIDYQVRKHGPKDENLQSILKLIQTSFAYMDGVIDPPSSMHKLTVEDIARQCQSGEVWTLTKAPLYAPDDTPDNSSVTLAACMFLTFKPDCLYLGKLAVREDMRGQGLSRKLIELAERRARQLGKGCLELETRIELVQNHRLFKALGFGKTLETAHPGYDHVTSITMRKPLDLATPPQ